MRLSWRVSRLYMHDAGPATDGAVLGVGLVVATPGVDVKLVFLATERAGEEEG